MAGTNAANLSALDDPQQVDAQAGTNATKNALKQKIDQNVSEDTKNDIKARNAEYKRRAKDYFSKKMPQERKDQTIWRLKVYSPFLPLYVLSCLF
jgi:hypothetical protein